MRILIAHNFYQIPGGEDVVARSESELLRDSGEEVFFYERHNDELTKLSPLDRLSHLWTVSNNQQSYQHLQKVLKKFRPEIVHFHNIYYMMTPSVYRACHDLGIPVVQSLHNYRMLCANGLLYRNGHVCEDCLNKNAWEGVKHKCFRDSTIATAIMAFNIERSWDKNVWINDVDQYIAAAEFTRRKYADHGIAIDRISLKPHFLNSDFGKRKEHYGYALYLGRLSEEKGVDVLLQAWKEIKNVSLKIAGIGPLERSLKHFVDVNQLKNVEFLGFQNQDQCQELLEKAAVVIIPSVCYENFPRVVVEAYGRGVPVIASRLGSLAELIEDGQTGLLFNPNDSKDLARAVNQFISQAAKAIYMGDNARRKFEEKYTAKANYQMIMEIYRSVIKRTKKNNN